MRSDLFDTLLKGVLVGPSERLLTAQEKISIDAFTDEYKVVWVIIGRVFDVSRCVPDDTAFNKVLAASELPVETLVKAEALWARLASMPVVSDADFGATTMLILEDVKKDLLGDALVDSLEVLRTGVKQRDGSVLYGPDEALTLFREKTAEIEQVGAEPMPEFNIRTQKEDLLAELAEEDNMDRASTGIVPLDEMTMGGHGLGELWLPVAGTGVGKSMICTNIAWHRLMQGDNVVYFTTETLFKQIRHRIVARHTHLDKFGYPGGISSTKIKMHSPNSPTLNHDEIEAYKAAIEDFTDNPTYGQLVVCQIPDRTKMSSVESKLYSWQERLGSIDYCIIDSLDMLSAEVRRQDERSELNEVVNKGKALAVGYNGGKGLRVLAPWQANRSGQEEARQTGRYKINALGDTHMAAKRADLILALLENDEAPHKLKAQTLKFRDSTPRDFELSVFYEFAYIGSEDSLSDGANGGFDF